MPSEPDDTVREVTEVAVIRHPDLGVLLLHSALVDGTSQPAPSA